MRILALVTWTFRGLGFLLALRAGFKGRLGAVISFTVFNMAL